MNSKNEILNEIKTLAPTLVGITKQNCFAIPENYFSQGMPKASAVSNILDGEASTEKKESDLMYLDLMSEILADNFSHLKEVQVFKTPNDYFGNLTEDVVTFKNSLLAAETLGEPETLDKEFQANKYIVPENYFNNLSNNIISQIKQEEALGKFLNKTTFIVPENYFENLPQNILDKIKTPVKKGRVITLKTVRNVLAVAATLTLFIAGAWFLNTDKNSLNIDEQIAQLSTNDIEAYIASNTYEFENGLLAEYLMEEDSNDLFWHMDLNTDELDYYLQNVDEYNLNI